MPTSFVLHTTYSSSCVLQPKSFNHISPSRLRIYNFQVTQHIGFQVWQHFRQMNICQRITQQMSSTQFVISVRKTLLIAFLIATSPSVITKDGLFPFISIKNCSNNQTYVSSVSLVIIASPKTMVLLWWLTTDKITTGQSYLSFLYVVSKAKTSLNKSYL